MIDSIEPWRSLREISHLPEDDYGSNLGGDSSVDQDFSEIERENRNLLPVRISPRYLYIYLYLKEIEQRLIVKFNIAVLLLSSRFIFQDYRSLCQTRSRRVELSDTEFEYQPPHYLEVYCKSHSLMERVQALTRPSQQVKNHLFPHLLAKCHFSVLKVTIQHFRDFFFCYRCALIPASIVFKGVKPCSWSDAVGIASAGSLTQCRFRAAVNACGQFQASAK